LTPIRLLIAYDGSDEAAGATRAAGRLFPAAQAIVIFRREDAMSIDQASLARATLTDVALSSSLEQYELAGEQAGREVAARGRAIAAEVGLEATAAVTVGPSTWRGICDAIVEHGADVVVCGTRGRGGFARALLGSTSSALLHHAPVPVLVVPQGAGELGGPALIGYDGSDGAKQAIAAAARLLAGRPALVVHVWSSPMKRSFVGSSLASVPIAELHEIAGDLGDFFAESARDMAEEGAALAREAGLDARGLAIEAAPGIWRAISAAAAQEGAALIVAGSGGRGAAAATLLGSVASALAHNAQLPVLIARAAS
jgi:nucleotide-binding universal stress UspA family protein